MGVRNLSSILTTGDAGHILVDGALPQSAPLIDANIRMVGFRIEDVKLIVNSHAHFDHAGGIAALARASGSGVAASARLRRGGPGRTRSAPQRRAGVSGAALIRRRFSAARPASPATNAIAATRASPADAPAVSARERIPAGTASAACPAWSAR